MISAALTALLLTAAAPGSTDVYALVIGHNGGLAATSTSPALEPLRFADDDALRVARWIEALPAAPKVLVLTAPDADTREVLTRAKLPIPETRAPTRTAVFAAIDAIKTELGRRSTPATIYVFYAGHGLSGRLLLEPEAGTDAAITGTELQLALAALPSAKVFLFIDACRSQSLFTSRGVDLTRDIQALENSAAKAPLGVLTAAQSDKPAGEAAELMGGFFSHVLTSGLAGAADADGDDIVSFKELAGFVAFNTEAFTGQRPWFSPPAGNMSAPVVSLAKTARLTFTAGTEGRFRVESADGKPVFAEARPGPFRALKLTLPPGSYRITRRIGTSTSTATVELKTATESELSPRDFSPAVELASAARGLSWEDSSFQAPFTPEAVATLDAGFSSGREPVRTWDNWTNAFDLAGIVSPAPFGLPTADFGIEAAYRRSFASLVLSPRFSFRNATTERGSLRRFSYLFAVSWRILLSRRLELSPALVMGGRTVQVISPGRSAQDPFAPTFGAGLRIEAGLPGPFAVWLDARIEGAFVNVDGTRSFTGEPAVVLGLAVRP